MALFGSDRPVMPTFKTSPELDTSARSPYDDLNRIQRNVDRNDRNSDRPMDRGDDRGADLRSQERLERAIERNPERNARGNDRDQDRDADRGFARERDPEAAPSAAMKTVQQPARLSAEGTHPLIEGLFSKLPEPEAEWPLPARQKWLQTAANIFDLMYTPGEADAGELTVRVERNSAR